MGLCQRGAKACDVVERPRPVNVWPGRVLGRLGARGCRSREQRRPITIHAGWLAPGRAAGPDRPRPATSSTDSTPMPVDLERHAWWVRRLQRPVASRASGGRQEHAPPRLFATDARPLATAARLDLRGLLGLRPLVRRQRPLPPTTTKLAQSPAAEHHARSPRRSTIATAAGLRS